MDIFSALLLFFALNPVSLSERFVDERDFDSAIHILSSYKPTAEEKNKYNFLMATSHFCLNKKEDAAKYADKMFDTFEPLPLRYEILAKIMKEDLEKWKQDDLSDISRDMTVSRDRLTASKVGEKTQKVQKDIIDKLDKLIKEKEDAANSSAKGDPNGKAQGQGQAPTPMQDSRPSNESGQGNLDGKIKNLQENWGKLPEKERARAIQELTRDLPPRYKLIIEEYFKNLNKKD